MRRIGLAVLALAFIWPAALLAQEAPQPKRWTGVDWYRVAHYSFKAGKRDDAMKLIQTYFAPATEAAGTPPPVMALEHQTGPWDMTLIWAMPDGPADMSWEINPNELKWFGAMAQIAGGPEKAQEILEQFEALVASSTSTIALQRREM